MSQIRIAVIALAAIASVCLHPLKSLAVTPSTVAVDGVLVSGGGPVVDGKYQITFALYPDATTAQATWTESVTLAVSGGRFYHALGGVKPLPKMVDDKLAFLGVAVGLDPELPRQPIRASMFALKAVAADVAATASKATTAEGLSCTGCVGVKAMKFDGDVDLAGHSLKVKNLTATAVATQALTASTVTASAYKGDGSALTGVKVTGGVCKAGEVVTGVKPDGSVTCALGAAGSSLLGGKVSDTFVEVAKTATVPVGIPDNTGASAVVQASYGKVGTANSIAVKIALSNTDLSTVSMTLLPPDDKKTGLTVCDPCGVKDAKSYSKTLTEDSTLKSGSLKSYIGKSLEGIWTLQVLDTSFCLPQVQANAGICDSGNKLDGKISAFEISATVTSAQSVKFGGTIQLGLLANPPFVCEVAKKGHLYFDTKVSKLRFCDGVVWRALSDTCGNGILESGEECDDGNNTDNDGCSSICEALVGFAASKPGLSCNDVLTQAKASGTPVKDGVYWLDTDGKSGPGSAAQHYCDMTTQGGGWTLVFNLNTSDSVIRAQGSADFWLQDIAYGKPSEALQKDYKSVGAFKDLGASELLVYAHQNGALYNSKANWAHYGLIPATKGKTVKALLNGGNDLQVATVIKQQGEIAKNKYTRNAGDVFIDHGLPMIFNSTGKAGTDATNKVRIGCDFSSLCGHVNCNGHNVQGGYGGYHIRGSSYPLIYEAMPNFGYHPGPMGFGTDFMNPKGCGESVWSNKCGPETITIHVDFAILVR